MQEIKSLKLSRLTRKLRSRLDPRSRMVRRYIRGSGIEIGALHQPLPVPKRLASVKYVDRFSVEDLGKHYPELIDFNLKHVDIVDDGERLNKFEDSSVDFIIANHFLEHTQDPIGTIKRHINVLKPGGILYMAVPDKRYTFDAQRPNTSLDHFSKDHQHGPKGSYLDHVREYVRLVEGLSGSDFDRRVEDICRKDYSIHFHVWDSQSLKEFIEKLLIDEHKVPVQLLDFVENPSREECICILKKSPPLSHASRWRKLLQRSV